jgi:transcriptional regulator with XRE-family HTH domain
MARNQRSTTPADVKLGERIRFFRIAANKSQADLGDALGVSFQQIQKYEKGTNRVSATRLTQIAKALNCRMEDFQTGTGKTSGKGATELVSYLTNPWIARACRAMDGMDPRTLQSFVTLAERVGDRNAA